MSGSSSQIKVAIAGTGSYVPERVLTNSDLEIMVDTSDEWITTRTGIKERRIAAEDEFTSHMAVKASRKAIEQAGISPSEVERIIVATITPNTLTPATACYVQHELGAHQAVAFDISAACSGFLYAMRLAERMISGGTCKNALILGAEKLSAFVNWDDRSTCVLFGDGAGAALLKRAREEEGQILAIDIGTDGGQTDLLNIPGGGSACPITQENADQRLSTLAMVRTDVFKQAVTRMRASANSVIERSGLRPGDIKLLIPHQANLRIIEAITKRIEIPEDRVFVNLHKYGNTSAAACAIALDEAHRAQKFGPGDHIVMVAFGAGLTWASAAIRW